MAQTGAQRNPCERSRTSALEERAIVRVYILGPATLATSSQALSVFLAVWRRGGGPRYNLEESDIKEDINISEELDSEL